MGLLSMLAACFSDNRMQGTCGHRPSLFLGRRDTARAAAAAAARREWEMACFVRKLRTENEALEGENSLLRRVVSDAKCALDDLLEDHARLEQSVQQLRHENKQLRRAERPHNIDEVERALFDGGQAVTLLFDDDEQPSARQGGSPSHTAAPKTLK